MKRNTYPSRLHPAGPGLLDRPVQLLVSLSSIIAAVWSYGETRTRLVSSQEASVLFTDVVGFSHVMCVWPLERVISSLEYYFQRLSQCVHRHRGEVDKFMGDGMMAVFESPDDAVRAACAIQREVSHYNSRQTQQARCIFPTRIVVDTGRVARTALGVGRERDWTVLGPVVNTASHLAKTLPPDRVFISHNTHCQLRDQGDLRLAEDRVMDEHGRTLMIYEVTSKI